MSETSPIRGIEYPSPGRLDPADVPYFIGQLIPFLDSATQLSVGLDPPSSPVEGDLWLYPASSIHAWMFAYVDSGTYKWKFAGGAPLFIGGTSFSPTADDAWHIDDDFITAYTVDRSGYYLVKGKTTGSNATANKLSALAISVGGSFPGSGDIGLDGHIEVDSTGVFNLMGYEPREVTSGNAITLAYKVASGSTAEFQKTDLEILPMSVN